MSQQNTEAVLTERNRILKLLYLSGITIPGQTQIAIHRGLDASKFRVGRDSDPSETTAELPVATTAIPTAIESGAKNKRSWSAVTAKLNAQRRAAIAAKSIESAAPTEAT